MALGWNNIKKWDLGCLEYLGQFSRVAPTREIFFFPGISRVPGYPISRETTALVSSCSILFILLVERLGWGPIQTWHNLVPKTMPNFVRRSLPIAIRNLIARYYCISKLFSFSKDGIYQYALTENKRNIIPKYKRTIFIVIIEDHWSKRSAATFFTVFELWRVIYVKNSKSFAARLMQIR